MTPNFIFASTSAEKPNMSSALLSDLAVLRLMTVNISVEVELSMELRKRQKVDHNLDLMQIIVF